MNQEYEQQDGQDSAEDDAEATRRDAGDAESSRASRGWWDRNADEYQSEHGAFLGDDRFVWGPEGLDEAEAGLLGPAASLNGLDVLEIGAGAAQCSRWLAARGARPVALDLSHRQLQHALRIGGRWVFSVTHPVRWAFPDEPGPEGLSVAASYFDRTPYVEQDERGDAVYVEHHRTLGDRVRDVVAGGFRLVDLVEPEWPAWNHQEWGGWSPLRGNLIPGTAIFVCERD